MWRFFASEPDMAVEPDLFPCYRFPFNFVQGLIQIWKTKGIVEVGEKFVNGDLFDDAMEKISAQVLGVPSLGMYVAPSCAPFRACKQIAAASST